MKSDGRFYVTTPIFYVNDRPHIGTAYTMIATDVLARFHRAAGYDTRYLTGLDEHGQKIASAAEAQGMEPRPFVDRMAKPFEDAWRILGTSHDDLIRTTEERHASGVQKLWKLVADRGDVYLGEYDGLYCVGCEAYLMEKDLAPGGQCPQGHGQVRKVRMPSYFFRLSKYAEPLLRLYEERPDFVRPASRMNEVSSFVREGLHDLSISRTSFTWGIPVPGDDAHVMYVWFDALSNYITALGWPEDPQGLFARYWPAAHHVIGKDILRFHAIYWPAMLMAAGLPVPRCVFAHGWLTINGRKMSKSLRNTVDPLALKWEFGNDAVRHYLMRDTVFGLDGDFNHDQLIERINSDLANDLGNLVNRASNLVHKLSDGRIPERREGGEREAAIRARAAESADEAASRFHAFEIARAIEAVWTLCADTNRFVQDSQPWTMKGEADRERRDACLYTMVEAIRQLAHMLAPVMPEKSLEILAQIGLEPPPPSVEPPWPSRWGEIEPGLSIPAPRPVFPRIDRKAVPSIRERLGVDSALSEASPEPAREADGLISIEEFGTTDLRIGLVLEAEPVPKTSKLLRLGVDLGEEAPRTIVAGIAEVYKGPDLVGKRIVVVANLRPAKLRGIESRGMLLAASVGGKPRILTVDGDAAPGTRVT